MQFSGNIPCFPGEQARFQRNKSDGVIGVDYRAWRSAGFSQQAGRDINRHNRRRVSISVVD